VVFAGREWEECVLAWRAMHSLGIVASIAVLTSLAVAAPAGKPVSKYMRDMGILYLETLEQLTPECGKKRIDDDCMTRWESTMTSIEDRVDIQLSDKSRRSSSGDSLYWELLKNVRYARKFYIVAYPTEQKAWLHAYVSCQVQAHSIALDGDFDGDGGCGTAIDKATHQ
jgi:hypothetical protein